MRLRAAILDQVVKYLSIGEFATRAELSVNTMKGYKKKGLLPSPDARVGKSDGWLDATVDRWILARRPCP